MQQYVGKTELAKKAKALNLDAIHDTVHTTSGRRPDEMARGEARHGKTFSGPPERHSGKQGNREQQKNPPH